LLLPKIALEGEAEVRRSAGKSRQISSRDPGAFRWNRKNTFIDN